MLEVEWIKSTKGTWLPLETVNLAEVKAEGVYVIWHGSYAITNARGETGTQHPRWVRVGQGIIKARLEAHRGDRAILAYRAGGLFVTWANVPASKRDGVERYLGEVLGPLVAERFPQADAIPVRLPLAA